jgi:hypothetical protein
VKSRWGRVAHASAVSTSTVGALSSGFQRAEAGGAASFGATEDLSPLGVPGASPRTDLLSIAQATST